MKTFLEFLSGRKTYIAAFGLVVAAVVSLANGDITVGETVTRILEGLGLGFLRAGVSKVNGNGAVTKP